MITDLEGNPCNWLRWTLVSCLLIISILFQQWEISAGILATYWCYFCLSKTTTPDEIRLDLSEGVFITLNTTGISAGVGLIVTFILHLAGL